VEGLSLKEFFLLLSSTGLAYRRCELGWINGDRIGVNFLHHRGKQKKPTPKTRPPQAIGIFHANRSRALAVTEIARALNNYESDSIFTKTSPAVISGSPRSRSCRLA
jgi:hypothetical protein